ncbi:LysR family transcriptional regulator [Photobacterium sp. R1]
MSKVTIEQWKMFVAVVEEGGFAQAGEKLFKTQPTVSHAIRKMEQSLEKSLFEVKGRKAMLTPFGNSLLPQAKQLVQQSLMLERLAGSYQDKIIREVSVAIDTLYPSEAWQKAVLACHAHFPEVNLRLYETCLSRASELLEDGTVQLAMTSKLPSNTLSQKVMVIRKAAVVSCHHPLARANALSVDDLIGHCQIVVMDGGIRNNTSTGWLGSQQRVTVSHFHAAKSAVEAGLGYAWLPEWMLAGTDAEGWVRLPLSSGAEREIQLQLGYFPQFENDAVIQFLCQQLCQIS